MKFNEIESQWRADIDLLVAKVRQQDLKPGLIAFYGSSTFRLWDTMSVDLAPFHVINLAFGGSTYADCVYFFPDIFELLCPEIIVLYAGDNDLHQGKSPIGILQDIRKLVSLIRDKFATAHIVIVSIKPSPDRILLLEKTIETNKLIEYYAAQNHMLFIDTFHKLIDKNCKKPFFAYYQEDALHLNEDGYKIWSAAIKDVLYHRFGFSLLT